ncbi:MAG: class I SAM-dependent methyltransferase, partial [Pseudomonadota bacterium]
MSDLANNAQSWVHTDLGHQVIAAEQATLESVFSHLFGYYLVQIGHPLFGKVTQSSLVNHRVFVTEIHEGQPHEGDSIVLASPEALPIACNSVDVVFLPHILENLATPALALREAYRILRPEGRLVVCGFNPWSLWPRWARHAQ